MAEYSLNVRLLPCAHTAAEWASSTYKDKILKSGEIGYEKDTGRYKMGDGETKWASLPWASAEKLSSSAGSATQPIYFSGGKPVACTYSLNKTVPADAKFTDTNTWRGIQNNLTSTSTTESLSAAQGKILNEKFANYLTTSGTAVAAKKLANYYSARQESANLTADGSGGVINFKATSSMKTGKPMTEGHILHFYWDNTLGWDAQFFIPTGDDNYNNYAPQWRGMNNKTWQDWRTFLDSGNYTSYTVKKDGTGASGTWGISITGNAKTATSAGKWSTARKITLTGSVTGSASIDGSGDVSLATTTNHTHGLLHSSFAKQIANTTTDSGWSMINDTYKGYILMSLRTHTDAPAWIQNNYAAGIAFGGFDTKGVLSMAYDSPKITFAGGNGTKPVWYFSLNATSGKTYTFSASGGTVLDSSNYSTNITNLTNGLTVFNGTLTPLTIKGGVSGNLESSISYTHPEVSSSNNWVVGMGTGGTGYGYFGFWNNAYGNVMRLSNNGSAYVSNSIYFGWQVSSNDGKARLFSDSEGGNISLVSPNNIEYQIDTVNDLFRIYRWNGSSAVYVLSTTDASGHIYNAGSKVICARNFTLSGNTLYITST